MKNERLINNIGVLDVDVDEDGLDYITTDGRRFADVRITLDDDAHVRMRTGYQCAHCLEVFQHAWPVECVMCGFPVGTEQRALVEQQYQGLVQMPPRGITADELARGEEEYLRKLKEARL